MRAVIRSEEGEIIKNSEALRRRPGKPEVRPQRTECLAGISDMGTIRLFWKLGENCKLYSTATSGQNFCCLQLIVTEDRLTSLL